MKLVLKSYVKPHTRIDPSGKVVHISAYTDKRTKKPEAAATSKTLSTEELVDKIREIQKKATRKGVSRQKQDALAQEARGHVERTMDMLDREGLIPAERMKELRDRLHGIILRWETGRQKEDEEQKFYDKKTEADDASEAYAYRISRRAVNSVRVLPPVGKQFDEQTLAEMQAKLKEAGASVTQQGSGLHVIDDDAWSLVESTLPMKQTKSTILALQKKEAFEERANKRKSDNQSYLVSSPSVPWIESVFGKDFENQHNLTALAKFLDGVEKKFEGMASWKWQSGIEKVGAYTEDKRGIDWKKLKNAYEQSKQTHVSDPLTPQEQATASQISQTGDVALNPKDSPLKFMQIKHDLEDTEKRMRALTDKYTEKLLGGKTTRAMTTTYNANLGQLAQRRDELKRMLNDLPDIPGQRSPIDPASLHPDHRTHLAWIREHPGVDVDLPRGHKGRALELYDGFSRTWDTESGVPFGDGSTIEESIANAKRYLNKVPPADIDRQEKAYADRIAYNDEVRHAVNMRKKYQDGKKRNAEKKNTEPKPGEQLNLFKGLTLTFKNMGRHVKSLMLNGTLEKAHVKAYQRTSASGQVVQVKEHEDKRAAARARFKKPRGKASPDVRGGQRNASQAPTEKDPAASAPDAHEERDSQELAHEQPQGQQNPLPAFTPIPHPTSEEETGPWLEAVMQEPDIVRAVQENMAGTPTDQIHKQADGTYTPARQQLHQAIVASMLNPKAQADPGVKPHVVILMGCPGAGKTTTLAPIANEYGVEFTTVNADDVKAKLPEYTGANAGLVHEESSDIAEGQLFPQAMQARHHLVMDITGANGKKVKAMVEQFHNHGYEISIAYAHLPAWKAATRVVDRFRKNGRFVPPGYVVNKVDGNPEETYNDLKNDPRVSHWRRYNNDVTKGTEAPLQEQGQRNGGESSGSTQSASLVKAVHRRPIRSHGRATHGQDPAGLPDPIQNAYRLKSALTKSLIYLSDDLASPDLDPCSRGVLLAERLRTRTQLDQLQSLLERSGYAS